MAVTICQGIDDLKKLIMIDGCFSIKMKEKILAELCCLKEMSLPIDGFKRISDTVSKNSVMDLFDNMNDAQGSPPRTAMQVRGVILCMNFPKLDDMGVSIPDDTKSIKIRFYDNALSTFDLPVYNFFATTNNTVLTDTSKLINKMQIVNDNSYDVNIEGLLLLVNPGGVKITRAII